MVLTLTMGQKSQMEDVLHVKTIIDLQTQIGIVTNGVYLNHVHYTLIARSWS